MYLWKPLVWERPLARVEFRFCALRIQGFLRSYPLFLEQYEPSHKLITKWGFRWWLFGNVTWFLNVLMMVFIFSKEDKVRVYIFHCNHVILRNLITTKYNLLHSFKTRQRHWDGRTIGSLVEPHDRIRFKSDDSVR